MENSLRAGSASWDQELGRYYMDFTAAVDEIGSGYYGPIDGQGVPQVDYDRIFHVAIGTYGVHYTPVTIAQYGLGLHDRFLAAGNSRDREDFLRQADWHVNTLVRLPSGCSVWVHDFPMPSYALRPPWVSGMAQGQGISLLCRAYQHTKREAYIEAAVAAFSAYLLVLEQGGVASSDDQGDLWYEEYPSMPASHVLNGFIFALWGLVDLYRVTGREEVRNQWDRGVLTLKKNLHRYEYRGWSRYDLVRRARAARDYHLTHVIQLEIMALLTGDELFSKHARRWRGYARRASPWVLKLERLVLGGMRRMGILSRPTLEGVSAPQVDERNR